jgi:hypothetical protein
VDHCSHGSSTFFGASTDESAAAFPQCSSPAQPIVMRALVGYVVRSSTLKAPLQSVDVRMAHAGVDLVLAS